MMRFLVFIVAFLLLFISCIEKKEEKKQPLLYEPSEMALLMRQMYEYNKVVRKQIIGKDSIIKIPEDFLTIHNAALTDATERDSVFEFLSKKYIALQKSIASNRDSAKVQFNKTIISCVECHQTRCDGPIPKIKRLLIE